MNETMQRMFRVLVIIILLASLLATGLMSPGTKSAPTYTQAFLKPDSLVKNENRAGFEMVVENLEGREVTYSALYHAGGFFMSRDDFTLAAGESKEITKDFDLADYGLTSPIKISIQVFSQEKRYNLFYWA
jgi:hypothetical protein